MAKAVYQGDKNLMIGGGIMCPTCGGPSPWGLCLRCSQAGQDFNSIKPSYDGLAASARRVQVADRFIFNREEENKEKSSPFIIKAVC